MGDALVKLYADEDISGTKIKNRKEFLRMMEELFEKAQEILCGRNGAFNLKHERQSNKYLFSTLIKCKQCG